MRTVLGIILLFAPAVWGQPSRYFPADVGNSWVLQHATGAQFTFKITSSSNGVVGVHAQGPWGASAWQMQDDGTSYAMTTYGLPGAVQTLSDHPIYFNFGAAASSSWFNSLGAFTVQRKGAIAIGPDVFSDAVQIRQYVAGSDFRFVFAAGVGLVRYSINTENFDLVQSKSVIAGTSLSAARPLPPVGILPNFFANQGDSPAFGAVRMDLLESAHVRFLLTYGNWAELEPTAGTFEVGSIRYPAYEAEQRDWSLGFTFPIIDMHRRGVPAELQNVAWDDPRMQQRVLALIDKIAPEFRGRLFWFQFGNEVDTYLTLHPEETAAFNRLFAVARKRLKELIPNVQVSTTLKYTAIPELTTTWKDLFAGSDLLALTYGPYEPDFRVKQPSVISGDLTTMLNAAGAKKVLFQEIAYPSGAGAGSSPTLQAEFYRTFLQQLRNVSSKVAAAQIVMMADLDHATVMNFSTGAGFGGSPTFIALTESIGLFDQYAQPKPSWAAIKAEIAR